MNGITAQVSIYPLRQKELSPSIDAVLDAFKRYDIEVQPGSMSTLLWGDSHHVFAALQDAFQKAASTGQVVMTMTVSNACPLPNS